MNALQKVRQLLGEIRQPQNPAQASAAWALAERLLGRMPVDHAQSERVLGDRDADGLEAIIAQLENKVSESIEDQRAAVASVSESEMTAALRAFRKRLKLARLSDESKLGGGSPLTSGKASQIDAIIPPTDYPPAVWRALVEAGKLKDAGQGFYSPV